MMSVTAKPHLRLDLHTFLPSFAIVDTAGQHDNKRAREACATIQSGEIVVFDKAQKALCSTCGTAVNSLFEFFP